MHTEFNMFYVSFVHLNDQSSEKMAPACSTGLLEAAQAAALTLSTSQPSIFGGPQSPVGSTTCLP